MKENKFKAGFKTCPNCLRDKCLMSIQIETDEETAYIYESCHECGYLKYFYDQSNELDNPEFYKDNLEGLEAKKYLHKLKLNRERVKNFRAKKNSPLGSQIKIDYCTDEIIKDFNNLKEELGLTSAKLLKELMDKYKKNV